MFHVTVLSLTGVNLKTPVVTAQVPQAMGHISLAQLLKHVTEAYKG